MVKLLRGQAAVANACTRPLPWQPPATPRPAAPPSASFLRPLCPSLAHPFARSFVPPSPFARSPHPRAKNPAPPPAKDPAPRIPAWWRVASVLPRAPPLEPASCSALPTAHSHPTTRSEFRSSAPELPPLCPSRRRPLA